MELMIDEDENSSDDAFEFPPLGHNEGSIISYPNSFWFNNFSFSKRPDPEERQNFFAENLTDKMLEKNEGGCSRLLLFGDINYVFKLDPGLDERSVGKINIMMSEICSLSKGKKLVDKLLSLCVDYEFNIIFAEGDEFCTYLPLEEKKRKFVKIEINFEEALSPERSTFAALVFDKASKNYSLSPITYPPFIMFAHELVHCLQFLTRSIEYQRIYKNAPSLSILDDKWQSFAILYHNKMRVKFLGESNNNKSCKEEVFKLLGMKEFEKVFGFSTHCHLDGDKANAGYFWNDNKEDESLTIIGNKEFNDSVFLMEALKKGLIEEVGCKRKSLFRWGHKIYSSCVETRRSLTQQEFNSCVRVFKKFLPADLK